jgi:hypothetical protein
LGHSATSQKVTDLSPDGITEFFFPLPIYLILPAALGPGVYAASNRYEYQKQKDRFLRSKAWLIHKADSLTAIFELIIYTMCVPQHLTTL